MALREDRPLVVRVGRRRLRCRIVLVLLLRCRRVADA